MLRRVLGVCLISVIVRAAVLPQFELRELDIFLQDEGYSQISRTKRTDNNTNATTEGEVEEEFSGGGSLDQIDMNQNETTNTSDTIVANATAKYPIMPLARSPPNVDEPPPETPEDQSNETDYSYMVQPRNGTQVNVTSAGDLEEGPQISEGNETGSSHDNLISNTTESNTVAPTDIPVTQLPTTTDLRETIRTELPMQRPPPFPPTLFEDAGPKLDVKINVDSADANSTAVQNSTDTIDSKFSDNSTIITQQATDAPNNIPPVVQNSTNTLKNNTKSSDTPTGANPPTTTKPSLDLTGPTTGKPVVGESDASKKSSVSGSGILFTIIILAVVAGLAGLGYYFYKKRQQGYDPVEIEDRDKEMTEIKSENGFGKPILAEEVKSQDQLTPYEPKPTPRTFGVASLHEEAFGENVDVIQEDSDKDRREQSVEFEEEGVKKD